MASEENGYSPVVVMVEREDTGDGLAARRWVEQSSYNSCEARDVFEAIEEMSDFTTEHRPDVIVLDANCCDDEAESVISTLEAIHVSEMPVSLLAVSESSIHTTGGGRFEVTPEDLPDQLEMLISQAPNA
jgi:DNA-binding response OmpR family regulator